MRMRDFARVVYMSRCRFVLSIPVGHRAPGSGCHRSFASTSTSTSTTSTATSARSNSSSASRSCARSPAVEHAFPTPAHPLENRCFINNTWVTTQHTFPTINPGNGQILSSIYEATPADVDRAVQAAHDAFYSTAPNSWSQMTPRGRGDCLFRLSALLAEDHHNLALLESLDNGKTITQSETVDAPACATMIKYWAGWADKLSAGRTIPIGSHHFCYTLHEPVGVVAAIVPWNLPLIAVAAKLGPALTTGNTVVLKTAEQTPLSALRLARFIERAGFPAGVVNIISGRGKTTGEALIHHPLVDKISFTGSVPVGKHIAEVASKHVKRVTLELGGKNPVVVCQDADLDSAVESVHNGLFWNEGEACASGSRIFVHDKIYDEFITRSVKRAEQRKVGNPFDPTTQQGAQVSEQQMNKILGYIKQGKQEGATLLTGGERVGDQGYYIQPTVFADVVDSHTIFRDEIFGPVMTITRFSELDEVVTRANDTPYGLACGIFTNDIVKGNYLSRRIRAGLVFWNCYHVVDVSAPFGGMKQSGIGREGGEYGLLPYLEVKNVAQKIA